MRWILVTFLFGSGALLADYKLSFNSDIRPILSANCFECHGPDEKSREADLRLDTYDGATGERKGVRGIIPGDPSASEIIKRIEAADAADRMPPASANKHLSAADVATLKRWISEGAEYEKHWAFNPPVRRELPAVSNIDWVENALDRFVMARLDQEGLTPSPKADPHTLVKRLYLDLTGLPPSPEIADEFAANPSPEAYRRLVDQLLTSPAYGERWARRWLDLARYADTNGYEKDRNRSVWPWRDWVVNAINQGMPFDQFSIEQLAGDMLPNATDSQKVATGFHRNTMQNEEGGIDPLEFRFHAMTDRVGTTATVWMGLTVACAQCHTHKYDPITHTDYYELMAYLNNADEMEFSVGDEEKMAHEKFERDRKQALLSAWNKVQGHDQKFKAWLKTESEKAEAWAILKPDKASSTLPNLEILSDGSVYASGDQTKRDIYTLEFSLPDMPLNELRLEALPDERLPSGGPGLAFYEGPKGDFFLSEMDVWIDGVKQTFTTNATHTYAKIGIGSGKASAMAVVDGNSETGWSVSGRPGERHVAVFPMAKQAKGKRMKMTMLFERHFAAGLGRFRISGLTEVKRKKATEMPRKVESLLVRLAAGVKPLSAGETDFMKGYFVEVAPQLDKQRKQWAAAKKRLPTIPHTLVFNERPREFPRPTTRHHRGEFLQPREAVGPGLIEAVLANGSEPGKTRLDLANWLVSEANPLVARVTVNRHWYAFFGRGLVKTVEDFGSQGALPSHPGLLDWLAVEFMEQGWSWKQLHRTIVLSATYQQSSVVTDTLLAKDPENGLLARGPRFRVEAEMVRDIAMSVSGLLSRKMGGPGVFPPQPASVTDLAYGGFKWTVSKGEDRYRRGLYTFAKRTAPFAGFMTFDATSGESCIVKRDRSNTPLQALTVMNDEAYLEASKELARRLMKEAATDESRARRLLRLCLIRPVKDTEIQAVTSFVNYQKSRLNKGDLNAESIVGKGNRDKELAAWAMTARAVLNIDETITKE